MEIPLDVRVDRRNGPSFRIESERLHDAPVGVAMASAQHVPDEVDHERRRIPADGGVLERASRFVAGRTAEGVRRDDRDARERRRQSGDEPLRARDERNVRHDEDEVVRPLDHLVCGAVEELRGPSPVIVCERDRVLEVEPPGNVRDRREFVDRIFGSLRRKRLEPARVGSRCVRDQHPHVDLQPGRPLALGCH